MICSICGKPIVLSPSAAERAAKDVTGKSADYYRKLFTTHSACALAKRRADTKALMAKLREDAGKKGIPQQLLEHQVVVSLVK